MRLVLDASVVIDFLRRKDKFNSLYMKAAYEGFGFVMSGVTVAEVFAGASTQSGGRQNREWEEVLSGIEVRGVDVDMARIVGKVKFSYRLSLADSFVLALVMEQNLPLGTLDARAFQKVKGLMFYGVETKRGKS